MNVTILDVDNELKNLSNLSAFIGELGQLQLKYGLYPAALIDLQSGSPVAVLKILPLNIQPHVPSTSVSTAPVVDNTPPPTAPVVPPAAPSEATSTDTPSQEPAQPEPEQSAEFPITPDTGGASADGTAPEVAS